MLKNNSNKSKKSTKQVVEPEFDYSSLERQTNRYIKNTTALENRCDRPPAVLSAPIDVGLSRFIAVDDIPDISKLPKLPEYKRDFAFRYATEHKKQTEWASLYSVHINIIAKWLKDPGIQTWIAVVKMERRTWMYGQRLNLERKMFTMMNSLLDMRVTADNAKEALDAVKFTHTLLDNRVNPPRTPPSAVATQVNINTGGAVPVGVEMPVNSNGEEYTQDQIDNLKTETLYLEHLKDVMLEEEGIV